MPVRVLDYEGADITIVANTESERGLRVKPVWKEPHTAQWIDDYVQEGDIFYDVGANVGGYSFIAASRGATVYAFEPEAMNYGRLLQNMELNKDIAERMHPLCMAIWDKHELLTMHMERSEPGAAQHVLSQKPEQNGHPIRQRIYTVALDDLRAWGIPDPTHIKIDVDGYEERVLAGATNALQLPTTKSVMLEIDHKLDTGAIFRMLKSASLVEKGSWPSRLDAVTYHLFVRN